MLRGTAGPAQPVILCMEAGQAKIGARLKGTTKTFRGWRRLRQAVQLLALLLFVYLLWETSGQSDTLLPHDLFFRLDPLAAIPAMVASRSWIAPLALAGVTLILTLAVGRAWCGWICPLGTLLDWTPARRPRWKEPDIPSYWRQGKYFLLFTVLLAALFGSLTLVILDPITVVFRTVGSVVLPALGVGEASEGSLLAEQSFFVPNLLIASLFAGILTLNAIRSRFWCRYLCPLGGLLALVSNAAQIRHRVDEGKCQPCRLCTLDCPTGAIDPDEGFAARAAECTTCLDCVDTCPRGAVSFGMGWGLPALAPQDPSRRRFLLSLGAAAIGAALLWAFPAAYKGASRTIRPPGATEEELLSQCIRCGECVKVCPTGGLQPSYSAGRWDELWTPVLLLRRGYCDYSCNACGQVCPTQAIPKLSLGEKQRTVIGVAEIDRERCIAWGAGRHHHCELHCAELCPMPEGAIRVSGRGGHGFGARADSRGEPDVVPELCTGCGICEYVCPVDGEGAIRVLPMSS